MNTFKNILIIFFAFNVTCDSLNAQDTITSDPLLKFDMFIENGLSVGATRVNTNFTEFNTSNGDFYFKKNDYLLTFDGAVNFGWLFSKNDKIWSLKTGFNFNSRRADLLTHNGKDYRLTNAYLVIPVQFGNRYPLRFNTVKNGLFRAVEYSIGGFISSPVTQYFNLKENIDSPGNIFGFNYLKYGIITEFTFTALNNKGHGYKFGIRSSTDFPRLTKIRGTENELYPYFTTIGLVYYFSNDYFKRENK